MFPMLILQLPISGSVNGSLVITVMVARLAWLPGTLVRCADGPAGELRSAAHDRQLTTSLADTTSSSGSVEKDGQGRNGCSGSRWSSLRCGKVQRVR